jgi:uncharacterized protein
MPALSATTLNAMSRDRAFDARALDVPALARAAAAIDGQAPLVGFPRLAADLFGAADSGPAGAVAWSASGALRPVRGGEPEVWLHLRAQAEVPLMCQRCLGPVVLPMEVDRRIRFVRDEAEAERLDEESEDDVLAARGRIDLLELLEDELILALPLVPRHESCPQPVQPRDRLPAAAALAAADVATDVAAEPHPFAVLAKLRSGKP